MYRRRTESEEPSCLIGRNNEARGLVQRPTERQLRSAKVGILNSVNALRAQEADEEELGEDSKVFKHLLNILKLRTAEISGGLKTIQYDAEGTVIEESDYEDYESEEDYDQDRSPAAQPVSDELIQQINVFRHLRHVTVIPADHKIFRRLYRVLSLPLSMLEDGVADAQSSLIYDGSGGYNDGDYFMTKTRPYIDTKEATTRTALYLMTILEENITIRDARRIFNHLFLLLMPIRKLRTSARRLSALIFGLGRDMICQSTGRLYCQGLCWHCPSDLTLISPINQHVNFLLVNSNLLSRLRGFRAGSADTGKGSKLTTKSLLLRLLSSCPNLEHLHLEGLIGMREEILVAVLNCCPRLQFLHLSGNDRNGGHIGRKEVLALARSPSCGGQLVHLELRDQGEERLLDKAVKELSRRRPELLIVTGSTRGDSGYGPRDHFAGLPTQWIAGKVRF